MDVIVKTRADAQETLRRLAAPLRGCTSPGGARVRLPAAGTESIPEVIREMEGFARPLWGLAPLAAGGARIDGADLLCEGLANGTDPDHPEFWGWPADIDQRFVELAPIAFALCVAPKAFWIPLPENARRKVAGYLQCINRSRLHDNNWLWFRVLVNVALRSLDRGSDLAALSADLDRLESFYLGDGWYSDGPRDRQDHYIAFAMHYYSLIYAALSDDSDPPRCARFRERAALFARDYVHWFGADGAAVPYGRSLAYRFAQGVFWGALAFAGVQAFEWGTIRGLALRNLNWWLRRPIFGPDEILSPGYGYRNPGLVESYISPASPYWAFKWFLPLALPASHPFWSAAKQDLPELPATVAQRHPKLLICRDSQTDHVVALACGQKSEAKQRHANALYSKFCYSNRFGFSVQGRGNGLAAGAFDSMLALSEDGARYAVRAHGDLVALDDSALISDWMVLAGVRIRTWLVAAGEWHVRVHRVKSPRSLRSAEGGFALGLNETDPDGGTVDRHALAGTAIAGNEGGVSAICELHGDREAQIVRAAPDTNVLHRRTLIPTLVGEHAPGEFWLACAVLGRPVATAMDDARLHGFSFELLPGGIRLARNGITLLAVQPDAAG